MPPLGEYQRVAVTASDDGAAPGSAYANPHRVDRATASGTATATASGTAPKQHL